MPSHSAENIIKIVETSFSAPTHSLLKRRDEAELVLLAVSRSKLVEEVAREILLGLYNRYKHYPPQTQVEVAVRSFESLHKHDIYTFERTTIGEIGRQLREACFKLE